MRNLGLFIFLSLNTSLYSQDTYYHFQDEVFDEIRFREKLETIERLYSEQGDYKYTTANYKVLSMRVRKDSIIQNVDIFLSQSNSSPIDINTGVQRFLNKPLPNFELQDLSNHIKTNYNYRDKITLINLWFTSCAPCITEIPYLNYLKDIYKDQVHFIAITFDTKDKVTQFLTRKSFDFEHLVDGAKYLSEDLANNAFPKLILVDKKGIVRFIENGVMLSNNNPSFPENAVNSLKQQLDFLLNEK